MSGLVSTSSNKKKNNKKKSEKKKKKKDAEAERRKQEAEDEAYARALASTEESVAQAEALLYTQRQEQPNEWPKSTAKFFDCSHPQDLSTDEMRSLITMAELRFDDGDDRSALLAKATVAWDILEGGVLTQPDSQPQFERPSPPPVFPAKRLDSMKADELLDMAEKARELESYSPEYLPFQVTEPYKVSDEELERLRPLYTDLLSGSRYERLVKIVSDCDKPQSQWVALSALDYPFAVFSARKFHHTDKTGAPHLVERVYDGFFVLSVVVERVAKDKKIVSWCRDALRLEIDQAIICLALKILVSCTSGSYKPTKAVRKLILCRRSTDVDFEGDVEPIRELVADLADIFCDTSRNLDSYTQLLALQLPITCLAAIDPTRVGQFDFFGGDLDAKDAFLHVLEKEVKDTIEEEFFDVLNLKLFDVDSPQQQQKAVSPQPPRNIADIDDDDDDDDEGQVEVKTSDDSVRETAWNVVDRDPTRKCDREGCTNIGFKKCAGCMLVSYCSRQCQIAHWQSGHNLSCANNKRSEEDLSSLKLN